MGMGPEWLPPGAAALLGRAYAVIMRKVIGVTGAKVFPDLESLKELYPLQQTFTESGNVYGLWLSGQGVLRQVKPGKSKIQKLVFPEPSLPALEGLEAAIGENLDLPSRIQRMTRTASDKGVQVRWLDYWPGYTLTIGRPLSDDGWMHVEPIIPYATPNNRPILRLHRGKHDGEFSTYWGSFVAMWRNAKEP